MEKKPAYLKLTPEILDKFLDDLCEKRPKWEQLPFYAPRVIGQREDGTLIYSAHGDSVLSRKNSRKRRRDNIDFRYTVLLDKRTYNKLKTEK